MHARKRLTANDHLLTLLAIGKTLGSLELCQAKPLCVRHLESQTKEARG